MIFSLAFLTNSSETSNAVTLNPKFLKINASLPEPQPTSNIFPPDFTFLIKSLTINMIERLLLINQLIIQKALEDLNEKKKKKTPIYSDDISLKTHPLHQVKEDIEININLSIMSNVYTRYIRRLNNNIKSAEESKAL